MYKSQIFGSIAYKLILNFKKAIAAFFLRGDMGTHQDIQLPSTVIFSRLYLHYNSNICSYQANFVDWYKNFPARE